MNSNEPHTVYSGVRFAPGSNAFVFIVCSVLALAFWFLKSMEERYVTEVSLPIEYQNFPENKILKDSLPGDIKFEVDANGWDLLALKTGTNAYPVSIDLSTASGRKEINLSPNSPYLEDRLPEGLEVLSVNPRTLRIEFDKKLTKRVPVNLDARIKFAPQYALADSISIAPREVNLEGPESYIESVDTINTEPLRFDSLSESIDRQFALRLPNKPFVQANHNAVHVQIPVDKLTEGKLTIPVRIRNPLFKGTLTLVPSKVDVIYQTTLNQYESIHPEDFRVTVDASLVNTGSAPDKLPLKLVSKPEFVYNIRLQPGEVNYIIENREIAQ